MTARELELTRAAFVDGLKTAAEPRVPRFGKARLLAAAVVVVATGAFAQLVTFAADTPAQASQVNANFTQLRTWLEQKVGTVGNGNVTTGALTSTSVSTGNVTSTGSASFGATTRQMLNLYNLDYGIGVNGGTLYYRSGSQHAWFRGGGHVDSPGGSAGAGGNVQMLLSDTQLTVNGALQANGSGGNVPNNCVVRQSFGSYQAACSAGEIAVGGGGRCASLWRLTESLPWGGASDANQLTNGQPARAWRAVCQVWGDAGTYTFPQLGVHAICCRQ